MKSPGSQSVKSPYPFFQRTWSLTWTRALNEKAEERGVQYKPRRRLSIAAKSQEITQQRKWDVKKARDFSVTHVVEQMSNR